MSTIAFSASPSQPRRLVQRGVSSLLLSALVVPCFVLALAVFSGSLWHWFLVPVTLCGILIGADALEWTRGRVETFNPIGLVGLLGLHFFFFAPLLHVLREYWMPEVVPPDDWRVWIGWMALLNAIGLLTYRVVSRAGTHTPFMPAQGTSWQIVRGRFWIGIVLVMVGSALLQTWVYVQYGGIVGYISSLVASEDRVTAQGMGWLFVLGETFPLWAMMAWVVYAREKPFARSWLVIVTVLAIFFGLQLLFGGLRGSRGNTVWGLLGAVGILHHWIRPIPRKLFLVGGILLFIFMYGYGLFKAGGLDALQTIGDADAREEIIAQSGRNIDYVMLGDLGRSDVQAYVLYKLLLPDSDFQYAWGRTYVGGVVSVVPSGLWAERPQTKLKEGTEALYGAGTYVPGEFWSSRQYGLAGEALLNFGLPGVLVAFFVFGIVVRQLVRFQQSLVHSDARWFLMPILSVTCFVVLASDSDNITLILLTKALIPGLFLWGVTRRASNADAMGEHAGE